MAGRIGGPKVRNSGRWTDAQYRSFIKGNLRRVTQKWGPIADCLKEGRTRRGFYTCNGCKEEVPASIRDDNGKRIKNIAVDHIIPIIDPDVGWVSWDETIERMFAERDNLQLLCYSCHSAKGLDEKARAKARRDREKLVDEEVDD